MNKRTILCFTLLFLNFLLIGNGAAWNDKITHKALSSKAVEKSALSANIDYLKSLGLDMGVQEKFGTPKTVKEWIEEGAILEDEGNALNGRFYNHFHNPLYTWSQWGQAGLTFSWPWVQNGKSAVLWAVQDTGNDWRWQKVRDYYYNALIAQAETERSTNFAQTFRGLGQLVHLVQDAAQPAHVRNDPHPADDKGYIPGFEFWAKNPANRPTVNSLISTPTYPTVDLNTSPSGYAPVTQFFDTDQYNGGNPPSGTAIGLAEYTNANFFSEDTIVNSNFPYPTIAATTPTTFRDFTNTFWSTTYPREYYLKNGDGETNGGQGYLLSAVDYLDYYRQQYPLLSFALPKKPVLDDNVYKDYASLLIPRAVGYSAGLLDYFFRGQFDMKPDQQNPGQYVIENATNEDMSGTFSLFYDNTTGIRQLVPRASWELSINSNGKSSSVTFIAPTDFKELDKYILVFQGNMGSEAQAVAGKVVTLSPPSPPYMFLYATRPGYMDTNYGLVGFGTYPGVLWNYKTNKEVPVYDEMGNRITPPYYLGNPNRVDFQSPYPWGVISKIDGGQLNWGTGESAPSTYYWVYARNMSSSNGPANWTYSGSSYFFGEIGDGEGDREVIAMQLPNGAASYQFKVHEALSSGYEIVTGTDAKGNTTYTLTNPYAKYRTDVSGRFISATLFDESSPNFFNSAVKGFGFGGLSYGFPYVDITTVKFGINPSALGLANIFSDKGRAVLVESASAAEGGEIFILNGTQYSLLSNWYSRKQVAQIAVQFDRPAVNPALGEKGYDYSDNAWTLLDMPAITNKLDYPDIDLKAYNGWGFRMPLVK